VERARRAPFGRGDWDRYDGGPTAVQALVYWLIVGFLRLVTRVFFRAIEVVGKDHIPPQGPVIFVGNHPNSLVDPVVILSSVPRRVSFAARDGLFSMPHLIPILWALGAIPIKRRQDQGEKQVDNHEAFSTLHAVLKRGGAFGIFPEGVSYTESELQPLKTGAARIALSAVREGIDVQLVPVGLSYRQRDHFRGRVLVQFGRSISLKDWLDRRVAASAEEPKAEDPKAEDPKAEAKALTADLELALRALTLNAPDFDVLRVLDGVRRLYVPEERELSLSDEAEVTRRLVDHYQRKGDDPALRAFYVDVSSYLALLDAMGLSDWDLRKPISRFGWSLRIARHVGLMLFTLPLALPGLLLHFPLLYGATVAGEMVLDRDDVRATLRMMVGVLSVLGIYLAVFVGLVIYDLSLHGALYAALVVFGLALSGLAAIRVLERQYVIRHGLSVLLRILSLKDQLDALRKERDLLQRRLAPLVEEHISGELDRIVSQEELLRSQPG